MELPILFTLVTSFIVLTNSHPKTSGSHKHPSISHYQCNQISHSGLIKGSGIGLKVRLLSDIIIPKDYYKRQILQPIPGYIPVYIKADGEPLVRRENKKPIVNVHPQKATELKEKNLSKHADKISVENDEKSGTETESDVIKNSKNISSEFQDKTELTKEKLNRNENVAKADGSVVKTQTVS